MLRYLTLSKLIDEGGADSGLSGCSAARYTDHEGSPQGRQVPPVGARHAGAVLCHLDQIFLKIMLCKFLVDYVFKLQLS